MSTARPVAVDSASGDWVSLPDPDPIGVRHFATASGPAALAAGTPSAGDTLVFDGAGGVSFATGGGSSAEPFLTFGAATGLTNYKVATNLKGVTLDTGTPGQLGLAVRTIGKTRLLLLSPGESFPYALPTGAKKARFYVQGAGGAGGGGGGGGGGAGATVIFDYNETTLPSTAISITNIAFGVGGVGGAGNGGNGGNTVITLPNTVITAYGGGGGITAGTGGAGGGAGGAAATTTQGAALANYPYSPQGAFPAGIARPPNGFYMGGAGGGARGGGDGGQFPGRFLGATSTASSGGGAASYMAAGAAGGVGANGTAGVRGAGGGGGAAGFNGGAGGDGCVFVEYITAT